MKFSISSNAGSISKLIRDIEKDIRNEVIPKSLDPILSKSLQELKETLLSVVNEEIRYEKRNEDSDTINSESINIAKSDQTIIKHLGYDIDKVAVGSFSKDSYDAKVKYIQNYKKGASGAYNLHCRVEVPTNQDESVESIYEKALKNFQDSIYVDTSGFKVRYFILTEKGKNALKDYVKIYCSTRTGIQDSQALIKANKRRKAEVQKGKDFSFWALKQDGLNQLLNPANGWSIDISEALNSIKSGNFQEAKEILNIRNSNAPEWLNDKIEVLEKKKQLTPDTQSYFNLIDLIKNLKLSKKLDTGSVTYTLVSEFNEASIKDFDKIFLEIKSQISIWKIVNQTIWIDKLVKILEQVVKNHLGE